LKLVDPALWGALKASNIALNPNLYYLLKNNQRAHKGHNKKMQLKL